MRQMCGRGLQYGRRHLPARDLQVPPGHSTVAPWARWSAGTHLLQTIITVPAPANPAAS